MSNIQRVELNIQRAKDDIAFGEALERLLKNRDFVKVVTTGYQREEAIRLVHLTADPGMQSPEEQADIAAQISAVGRFSAWLRFQVGLTENARKALAENTEELEELRREEAEANH